jgi:hypothetical protein
MPTDEERDLVHSELTGVVSELFAQAERLENHTALADNPLVPILSTWWRREAHLAVERAHNALAAGVPDETAWFLAVDDPGFQLAAAAGERYVPD